MAAIARYSNCVIEAIRAYRQLRRQGQRVVLTLRPTDADDPLVMHVGWAVYDPVAQVYRPASFRPVDFERSVPVWKKPARLLFKGLVVEHDDPPPADALPPAPAPKDATAP